MRFKKRLVKTALAACATVGLLSFLSVPATAQPAAGAPFISFSAFLQGTADANYTSYVTAGLAGAVRSGQAFNEMRSYILATYRGVKVEHSFILDGSYVDCVTLYSQPTARDLGISKVVTPPALPATARAKNLAGVPEAPLIGLGLKDSYGNAIACPDGTTPMERMSLSQLTEFPTVSAFLAKSADPFPEHRYAVGEQDADSFGAISDLNIWNPKGYFTLSQQWLTAGSGDDTQTVEAGWLQNAAFGPKSRLFIYYTSHDYDPGTGCYNRTCDGFMQVSSKMVLGAQFPHYSTPGGTQYAVNLTWMSQGGNWFLYVNDVYIGYYPAKIFKNGPMSLYATETQFGGETTISKSGEAWPQMGSGRFPSAGYKKAAFQADIYYFPGNSSPGPVNSTLSYVEKNPDCYKIDGENGPETGTYIFFGGPGGDC